VTAGGGSPNPSALPPRPAPTAALLAPGQGAPVDAVVVSLFEERYPALVQTARLLVDDTEAAEEVVQEAFVRLYSAWPLRDPARAHAYLRSTVWNLARDRLRRRRTSRRHQAAGAGATEQPAPGPADTVVAVERRRAVSVALDRLPRRQRECVLLRYWSDLSDQEIAETLGIGAGSVKRHLHRARATLAALLDGGP
jgi:RNA polymerase sigma-70 factor (sigma-E family)